MRMLSVTVVLAAGLLIGFSDPGDSISLERLSENAHRKAQSGERIVFLGGTLISHMDNYGYLEAAMTAARPGEDVTFRNLGWPADDVFGTARGEFGSTRNTRSWQPPEEEEGAAYAVMLGQIEDVAPNSILVAYGGEAAFARDDAAFEQFASGYRALIESLGRSGRTLILMTPMPHCASGSVLEDPSDNNRRLEQATDLIRSRAEGKGYALIDLFSHFEGLGCDAGLYENGIHLNEAGYRELARYAVGELDLKQGSFSMTVSAEGELADVQGASIDAVQVVKNGVRFDVHREALPAPWDEGRFVFDSDEVLQGIMIDGVSYAESENAVAAGPSHEQFERLRAAIIEKNRLHREKIRPLNLAYIYLFRQHEMGHLAHEIADLEELIEGQEQVIALLKKPIVHRYEIRREEGWQAPRVYPDHEVPQYIPEPNIAEELEAFTIQDGFEVNLFAADPMIANPINMNWDTRGRAWVATSSTYPHLKPGDQSNDRIVILEDADGDGVAEKSTVFADGLLVPHSVMPVKGGAYVAATTELLFLADHDGDDVADEKRVVYSGFGNADVHHMIHGLRWAPWGDLYFTQSIYINTFVETPHGPRRLNGSGTWAFRPETEQLDVYSRGMVNPWGFAFDASGQSFGTDGAGGSGPHYVFPGAKHPTAVGAHRVLPGLIPGKPKNTAAEFVSGRHMPEEWLGSLLSNDFRANRTVRYILTEDGSGYSAEEAETVLHSSHRSYRPVDLKMGPDGALYIVDWYNPIIDHGEVDFYHPSRDRSHGRIWRLTTADRPLVERPSIAGEPVEHLLGLLQSPEQYTRSLANRELANRSADEVVAAMTVWLDGLDSDAADFDRHRLEALWLTVALNRSNSMLLDKLLKSPLHEVRAAAVRMIDRQNLNEDEILQRLAGAVQDDHAQVRLEAVNALRVLETESSVDLALQALDHPVDDNIAFSLELTVRDAREEWIPRLLAGEHVFDGNRERLLFALMEVGDARAVDALLGFLANSDIDAEDRPRAIELVASLGTGEHLDLLLEMAMNGPALLPIIAEGAAQNEAKPADAARIELFFSNSDVAARSAALRLAGIWNVESLKPRVVEVAKASSDPSERRAATAALAQLDAADELRALAGTGNDPDLRAASVAALGRVRPAEAAALAIEVMASLEDPDEAATIVPALIASDEGLASLKSALENATLPQEVAVAGIRAVRSAGRYMEDVIAALSKAGGLKPVPPMMEADERRELLAEVASTGDANRGRSIYRRDAIQCTLCHVVDGEGGKLGPDLSTLGTYMTPESILESILNPNTDIKQGYETIIVRKTDGSLVSGLLQRETDDATLLRIPGNVELSIPNRDIESIENTPYSLMPAALSSALRRDEMVDLMKYLSTLGQ